MNPASIRQFPILEEYTFLCEKPQLAGNCGATALPLEASRRKIRRYDAVTRHFRRKWISSQRLSDSPARPALQVLRQQLVSGDTTSRNAANGIIDPLLKCCDNQCIFHAIYYTPRTLYCT
jgi:hypothetical protein